MLLIAMYGIRLELFVSMLLFFNHRTIICGSRCSLSFYHLKISKKSSHLTTRWLSFLPQINILYCTRTVLYFVTSIYNIQIVSTLITSYIECFRSSKRSKRSTNWKWHANSSRALRTTRRPSSGDGSSRKVATCVSSVTRRVTRSASATPTSIAIQRFFRTTPWLATSTTTFALSYTVLYHSTVFYWYYMLYKYNANTVYSVH